MVDKFIFALLIFLVVFTPLAFGTTEPWSITVMQLTILILLLAVGIKVVREERLRLQSPVLLSLFLGFVLFVFVQTLHFFNHTLSYNTLNLNFSTLSFYPYATLRAWLKLLTYFILFLIVSHYFASGAGGASDTESRARRLSRFVNIVIFFGFTLSLFAIVQHFTFNEKIYWLRELSQKSAPFGPFVNRNHYAGYMELTVPLALGLIFAKGIPAERVPLYAFMSAIMSASLFLSASRSGVASFFCQLLFLAFLVHYCGGRKILSFANALIFIPVLSLVFVVVFWLGVQGVVDRMSIFSTAEAERDYAGRLSVWSDALTIAKDFPIVGTGLGTFPLLHAIYKSEKTDMRYLEAHNDYLQIFSETGLIGSSLLFLLGAAAMVKALRLVRDTRYPPITAVRIGGLTGCFGLLVHSLTDFNLQIPANAVLFVILAAIVTIDLRGSVIFNRSY